MADEGLEKKHHASGKRLGELRGKGQTLRSRDLASGLIFLMSMIMLYYSAKRLTTEFFDNFIIIYQAITQLAPSGELPFLLIYELVNNIFYTLLPMLGAVLAVTILSPFAFGGWNFTLQVLNFKPEKLNFFANIGNIFSKRSFVNVGTSFVKTALIVTYTYVFIRVYREDILYLCHTSHEQVLLVSVTLLKKFLVGMSIVVIVIILFDTIYHYFEYLFRTMMTSQEVKEEGKEQEGNPEIKRKMKSLQFALIRQRLNQTIPTADVVVTNPTHYAVALRYTHGRDKAPKVIAKGHDRVALHIRTLAIQNGVTIYEAPLLARALYRTTKLNAEIQSELYMAVAIVLSYVQNLKNYQQGIGEYPVLTTDLKIPKHFIFKD
jgi:flagellar biosynthesis protein FlhB